MCCNRAMAAMCLACSVCGLVMPTTGRKNKKSRAANGGRNPGNELLDSGANRRGRFLGSVKSFSLVSSLPVLLVTVGNIPEIIGLYSPYVYLPKVCF